MRFVILAFIAAVPAGAQVDELDIPRSSVPGLPAARTWNEPFEPLSVKGKLKYQMYATFGPWGIVRSGVVAGIDQWQNDPEEWGQGWGPYGKRMAGRVGMTFTRRMIVFGVGALRGEDPRFFRSGETGAWRRVRNQLMQTVLVRTDSGGTTIAAGRMLSAMSASQISQAWLPRTRDGYGENAIRGGMVLVGDLGTRILREFWPDIRAKFRRKPARG